MTLINSQPHTFNLAPSPAGVQARTLAAHQLEVRCGGGAGETDAFDMAPRPSSLELAIRRAYAGTSSELASMAAKVAPSGREHLRARLFNASV